MLRAYVGLVPPGSDDRSIIEVANVFEAIARSLLHEHEIQGTLDRIVHLAVETLDACEFAGISYVDRREITSPASTDDVPRRLDEIQAEVDQGPCIDAIRSHHVFQTGDLRSETRWPRFAVRAYRETGVQSVVAVRLFAEDETMGALNLYSTNLDAFDATDVALAVVFGTHAAVAMISARREDRLHHQVESRDLIGRAKGMLAAREGVTDEEAFAMLRRASQRLNIRLTRVAEQVVEPPPDPAPHREARPGREPGATAP
jgi:GAF domain-containing protein